MTVVDLKKCKAAQKSMSEVITPSHPHTVTPSHCHTLSHTVTLSHCHTLILTLSHPHTVTPSHHHTVTPSHCHTSHPHFFAPSHPPPLTPSQAVAVSSSLEEELAELKKKMSDSDHQLSSLTEQNELLSNQVSSVEAKLAKVMVM